MTVADEPTETNAVESYATLPAYYFERPALDRLAAGAAAEDWAPVVTPEGKPVDALPWAAGRRGAVVSDKTLAHNCGVIIALPFVVGLMLWVGWNYGLVEAVDGVRAIGFWPCVALVCLAMGVGACVRLLFKGVVTK